MAPIPPGFTPISELKPSAEKSEHVSFLGVVLSVKGPFKTNGRDFCLHFEVQDLFHDPIGTGPASITMRAFYRQDNWFPSMKGGDLVVVRRARVTLFNDKPAAVSVFWTTNLITFEARHIPVQQLSLPYQQGGSWCLQNSRCYEAGEPTRDEQVAVMRLKWEVEPLLDEIKAYASSKHEKVADRKMSLIRDVSVNRFYDIRCQVVKLFEQNEFTVDLCVSDYTENTQLFYHDDPLDPDVLQQSKWQGPYGQFTLAVRVYGASAKYLLEKVMVGDFICLHNVRIKLSPNNIMEGQVSEDKDKPGKRQVSYLKYDHETEDIKMQKKVYQDQRADRWRPLKRSKQSFGEAAETRREENRETKKPQKEVGQQDLQKKVEVPPMSGLGVNPNVTAGHPEIKLSALSELVHPGLTYTYPNGSTLELPFVNSKHRTRVRVVDFRPNDLRGFAIDSGNPKFNPVAKEDDRGKFQWKFHLFVEEAHPPKGATPTRGTFFVTDNAGVQLLQMRACDLQKNPQVVKKLEHKLSILWGNLFELKQSRVDLPLSHGDPRLQNKPFDCCVQEYARAMPTWDVTHQRCDVTYQRLHNMFGTTIMD
ncbi:hypothetical protein BDV96DRAFT_579340 [Lophiotrema nucula]|uniref:Protection of telomeres protein 1 n=1 Tax=Lophiotrema nucula TaxID=690887 RepID=A0A6A5Z0G4_9PLEO|nr:hypothetical protein BDV96DRAFT_579340 [Lophiotrema nucula]